MKPKTVFHSEYKLLLFVFLAFFFMVLMSYLFASTIVERHIATNAEEVLATAETKIQAQFREAELYLINVMFLVSNRISRNRSNDEIEQYIVDLTEWITTSYKGAPAFIGAYGYIQGEYLDGNGWEPPGDYDPRTRPWYKAAMEYPGATVFTAPYISMYTDSYLVSVVRTVDGPDGEICGVVGIDIDISEIADYVRDLQFNLGGYGLLVAPDLTFLVHPDRNFVSMDIREAGPLYAVIANEMEAGLSQLSGIRMQNSQGEKVVVFYKKMFNSWFVGIAVPRSNYYRDIYLMALILTILGIVLMLALDYFLVRLTLAKLRSDEESQSKSSFLARMSHEIRTPMNSILGMSELIMRKNLSGDMFEYVSIIQQAGNTLLAIINDILDFSKIESGNFQIETREYHFSSLMNDVINVIRERLTDKPLDFFVSVDSHIPAKLIGDDVRIRQILINLLNNAVKYTHGGHVSLDVKKETIDAYRIKLFFEISDTGIGISEKDLELLFNDFVRLDMKRNQGVEGTGLGLPIANTLCRAMGGEITVSSKYNEGSVFTAVITQTFDNPQYTAQVNQPEQKRVLLYEDRLPYAESFLAAAADLGLNLVHSPDFKSFIRDLEKGEYNYAFVSSKYAMECIPVWGRRRTLMELVIMVELGEVSVYQDTASILMPVYANTLANVLNGVSSGGRSSQDNQIHFIAPSAKVLIVDDIATNLRVAAELMAPYKMHIDTCMNGQMALDFVREQADMGSRYDIIFMDHMMPGMDGIEVTERIRNMDGAIQYYRETPIVMLTANALSGQREMFLQNGVDDFLAKPIEMQKLAAILDKWIPGHKKKDAVFSPTNGNGSKKRLPEIAGLNTQTGLASAGGSFTAYIAILSIFCLDANERIGEIREAAEAGDLGRYTTLVHALKSASRSIGAAEIGNIAEELEEAGKSRNLSLVKDKTQSFLNELQKLTENITVTLNQYTAEKMKDAEIVTLPMLKLGDLKKALIGMDIEAADKLMQEYKTMSLDTKTRDLVNEIEQYILLFEYEKAITRIDSLQIVK